MAKKKLPPIPEEDKVEIARDEIRQAYTLQQKANGMYCKARGLLAQAVPVLGHGAIVENSAGERIKVIDRKDRGCDFPIKKMQFIERFDVVVER